MYKIGELLWVVTLKAFSPVAGTPEYWISRLVEAPEFKTFGKFITHSLSLFCKKGTDMPFSVTLLTVNWFVKSKVTEVRVDKAVKVFVTIPDIK